MRRLILCLCAALCGLAGCASSSQTKGLLRPNGVAVAPDGTLYVMDRGNYRIAMLSGDGALLASYSRFGTGDAEIHSGWDIARASDGALAVANLVNDPEGAAVIHDGAKVFAPGGALRREVGATDYDSNGDATRFTPYGLDIDAQDRLWLADFTTASVRVFDHDGRLAATLFGAMGSGEGEFLTIQDVAVDDGRGLVYAADAINSRVQQFQITASTTGTIEATFVRSIGGYGHAPGQFAYPQYLAVDERSGRWYVSDMGNERVQGFDAEGNLAVQFAPPVVERWQALGLAVGSDGVVYVADALNNLIWAFNPDGTFKRRIEVRP